MQKGRCLRIPGGELRTSPPRRAGLHCPEFRDAARAVTDLEFIVARARTVRDDAALRDRLEGHNAFLDRATPREMIRAGRTAEVPDAITGDGTGDYA